MHEQLRKGATSSGSDSGIGTTPSRSDYGIGATSSGRGCETPAEHKQTSVSTQNALKIRLTTLCKQRLQSIFRGQHNILIRFDNAKVSNEAFDELFRRERCRRGILRRRKLRGTSNRCLNIRALMTRLAENFAERANRCVTNPAGRIIWYQRTESGTENSPAGPPRGLPRRSRTFILRREIS